MSTKHPACTVMLSAPEDALHVPTWMQPRRGARMIARAMTASDRRFVAPTWAQSCRYGGSLASRFRIVDRLLDGPFVVTCFATDTRTVHAWCAHAGEVLLYVYVAPELRRHGLASRLVAEAFPDGPKTTAHPKPRWFLPRCTYRPHALAEALAMKAAA